MLAIHTLKKTYLQVYKFEYDDKKIEAMYNELKWKFSEIKSTN